MILSDLISIPQHRDREYPEAGLLMGASISHCGKPASLLTPAQLCPGWSISPHGHWFTERRRTAQPGSGVSTPAAYVIGSYRENIWEWNKGGPVYSGVLFLTLHLKEWATFMATSSPSLHIISLCGSNQQLLISVFITRLIPRSLIVIQGEFSICAGAKYSHWTFCPFQPVQWIF